MIIGITGTNGAGKGTVVDYLVQTKGFVHYSARSFIVEEIERRGMPIDRDRMREVGNDLRTKNGPGYIIDELFKRAQEKGGDAVIESIRTVGELEALKQKRMILWAVDADRRTRFERSVLRGSQTDRISFEDFCMQEDREMSSTDSTKQNVFGVMQMAGHVFTNNGTPGELFQQVEEALKQA